MHAHRLQRERQQPGSHLLARGDHGVIFAGIVQRRYLARPGDQLVGLASHGRDDHGDLVAGVDLAFDVARDVPDAVDVGDGRPAEFHHDARHAKAALLGSWAALPADHETLSKNAPGDRGDARPH